MEPIQLLMFSQNSQNCCGTARGPDPAGDAWEGMKFEPYGRTLAKMLGTLLKVPCEARGAGGYPWDAWDAWDAWEGTAARSWCVDIVGTLHLRWSGNTAVWELGRGALGQSLEGMFLFLLAQTGTSQKVMPMLVRLSGKPDC